MKLLVTGGCGFIGNHFIRRYLKNYPENQVINLDLLTYAGRLENTKDFSENPNYTFIKGDVANKEIVKKAMEGCGSVVHFAAESQVDKAIDSSEIFIHSNVMGTHVMLEQARKQNVEKFVYISTDEVYGHIFEGSFTEKSLLNPRNPYAASKAGAERLAYSYSQTYGMDISITRCSNNFGPYQFPDKIIPVFAIRLMNGKRLPVYGDGLHVRDWLFVTDHCDGITKVLEKGRKGEVYNIGGGTEKTNLELTKIILNAFGKDESQIEYVPDRKGHDRRYSLDISKIQNELGYNPQVSFEKGLAKTIEWYKENEWWWKPLIADKESFISRSGTG